MKRVLVKICGITTVDDGLLCAEAGVDAVGFVFFAMSPRRMNAERAAAVARQLPPFLLRVGVFVNASQDEMARVADAVGLDLLQLHGDEPPEAFDHLPRRALKAVRVGKGFAPQEALAYEGRAAGLLVDTRSPGDTLMPGGTGRTFDWSLVEEVRARSRFLVLAGGLGPENVADAVATVRPDAVDVSSGVESLPGRKDKDRVRAFVEAVRAAEGALAGSGGR
jgi:phosphoribosylanthranilate isomerase